MVYLSILSLHVIAMVAWMAGMFYLPRLYVYHAQAVVGSEMSETFKVMERKLLKLIINPAMIVTWLAGLTMIWLNPGLLSQGWMHAKLLCVVLMSTAHGFYARWRKDFERDENTRSHVFYRYANEVPTVLLIIIVAMVIMKPF